jgi:hypothetical protein
MQDLATAEKIGEFAIGGEQIAWSATDHGTTSIFLSNSDRASTREVWKGTARVAGLLIGAGRLFWIEQNAPIVPECAPLPPLSSTCKVMAAPLAGGPASMVATLMEPEGEQCVGIHGDQLYISTFRPAALGTTVWYRIPLNGGVPQRIAGAAARQHAVLGSDGSLYWLAPSREASQSQSTSCIRRLRPDGKSETLTDWLPQGGRLADTNRGIVYVDESWAAQAWPIASSRELPRPLPLPDGYGVLAAGDGELLARKTTEVNPKSVSLFRVALP